MNKSKRIYYYCIWYFDRDVEYDFDKDIWIDNFSFEKDVNYKDNIYCDDMCSDKKIFVLPLSDNELKKIKVLKKYNKKEYKNHNILVKLRYKTIK